MAEPTTPAATGEASDSVKPRTGTVKARAIPPAPALPVLQKIINNIIELDPDYYFRKRYDEIHQAASELPVVIEYINESMQRAMIAANEAERDLQSLEAETYTELRQQWTQRFEEKMTEKALEMAVLQDEQLTKATKNHSVLKSYVIRLRNMQENLRAKLDMLRSVEATKRKYINDDPE